MKTGLVKNLFEAGLRSSVGVYMGSDGVRIVETTRTPFGVAGVRARRIDEHYEASGENPVAARELLRQVLERERLKTVTVGVRPSAVDFVADPDRREEGWEGGEGDRGPPVPQAGPGVLLDSIRVSVAKTRFVLTGRVRRKELEANIAVDEEEDRPRRLARFEPGPWAAWRASLHFAPLRRRGGVQLRYILGEHEGLAVLGDRNWPLAWQVLSWRSQDKGAALVQAFHMLNLYARRHLGLSEIRNVSVQGRDDVKEGWQVLEAQLGREVERVPGPVYDDEFIALGLALGGLESEEQTLDLGRSLRPPTTLMGLLPWKEMGFLAVVFAGMALVMSAHARSLREQLTVAVHENATAEWARTISAAELRNQRARLAKDVQPLGLFFSQRIPFAPALAAVARMIPPTAWVESLHGADYVWQTSVNRSLGNSYLLVRYAVPLVQRGAVPKEIDELVKGLRESPYIARTLPEVKLADINWKQEGAGGVTLFTVVAKPKSRS